MIELAQQIGKARGRPVGVYPETKHPAYFRGIGLPLEEKLLASLETHGWNRRDRFSGCRGAGIWRDGRRASPSTRAARLSGARLTTFYANATGTPRRLHSGR